MVNRKTKTTKGISFHVQILAWVDKQQTVEKNRSDIVNDYLQSCMEGKNLSLDDFAVPILKKMMTFFLSNKPSKAQLKRFQAMFSPEQSDYIETIFRELS